METVSSSGKRYSCRSFMKELFYSFLTEYETPKIVMIHSYTITSLLRIIQIIILFYSVFYLLLLQKGYQKHDTSIISSITLKVKGIALIHAEKNQTYVFDGTDYIIPASENNALFIMTSFIKTDQSRSKCTESTSLLEAICKTDDDCQNKPYMPNLNGRWTGQCLLSPELNISNTTKQPTGICEIEGWCPVEDDLRERTVINETTNFTIFIKNFIEFPAFQVKHKNMVENLKPCIFHPDKNKDCPIFRLDYIINEAEKNIQERTSMLHSGGVIRVKVDWDCNLDRSIKLCKPLYSFARLDIPSNEDSFSVGFNFRFASHWKRGKTHLRTLTKAFGLRLIITVSGKAGQFDFITLTLNTGSLVGIFGLATFLCDIILLNLTKKASLYRDHVFQRVRVKEALINSAKNQNERTATVYENSNVYDRKLSHPLWTSKPDVKSLDTTDTTRSAAFIESNDFWRLQPSLGLTNSLN